jgi:hypothetical protein
MLSTKNIAEGKTPKTFNPGNHKAKINSIVLSQGYNLGSYNVQLNVEGKDLGPDFEGFLTDAQDPTSPRYKGMIGRVRLSQYAYQDGVTPTGVKVNRDTNILSALKRLAIAQGKGKELDAINANTIEEFVEKANTVLCNNGIFLNFCFGGKEYESKGYKNYDLFIPNAKNGTYGFEAVDAAPSRLTTFDPAVHIIAQKTKTVDSFEPQSAPASMDSDFDLF